VLEVAGRFCYSGASVRNAPSAAPLTLADNMTWRVAIRSGKPGKVSQEIIDPEDWRAFSPEQQLTYGSVSEFLTEQEAERFAKATIQAALVTSKP
jgi:hypothetical protein